MALFNEPRSIAPILQESIGRQLPFLSQPKGFATALPVLGQLGVSGLEVLTKRKDKQSLLEAQKIYAAYLAKLRVGTVTENERQIGLEAGLSLGIKPPELLSDLPQSRVPLDLEGLTPGQRLIDKRANINTSIKLRQEFINRPEVKEFVVVQTSVRSMDSMLKLALSGDIKNKAALDQGLITMYNKLTDPSSVVRESEYARTPENLPTVNRILGAIQKIQEGGAGLTDDDRQALVLGAKIIANERGNTFNERRTEYTELALVSGINPELIIGTIQKFKPFILTSTKQEIKKTTGTGTQQIGRFNVTIKGK